jgi:hypothetical protein
MSSIILRNVQVIKEGQIRVKVLSDLSLRFLEGRSSVICLASTSPAKAGRTLSSATTMGMPPWISQRLERPSLPIILAGPNHFLFLKKKANHQESRVHGMVLSVLLESTWAKDSLAA